MTTKRLKKLARFAADGNVGGILQNGITYPSPVIFLLIRPRESEGSKWKNTRTFPLSLSLSHTHTHTLSLYLPKGALVCLVEAFIGL